MGYKKHFFLVNPEARRRCMEYIRKDAPVDYHVVIQEPSRTLDQNAAQWPLLDAIAEQVMWEVDGIECKMTSEEWKDVLTAGFRKEKLRRAAGWEGGTVMLGSSTSAMTKREFSEWLEFLHYVITVKNVTLRGK